MSIRPQTIASTELKQYRSDHPDVVLLDVREEWECEIASIPGSTWIPMELVSDQIELQIKFKNTPIVVYCHHGIRSHYVGLFLISRGYSIVSNLIGGIDSYSIEVDSEIVRY